MEYLRILVLLLWSSFCGLSSFVHAQEVGTEWDILNQEAMDLYRAGNYDRAELVALKALLIAKQNVGPNHPDVAVILNNLAGFYETQGNYASAELLFKRSLAIREKVLGPDHLM